MGHQELKNEEPGILDLTSWPTAIRLLEQCLCALQKISPVASPAALRDVLPLSAGEFHRLLLVELIKFDMAVAAEVGLMRPLSEYLQEFSSELPVNEVPVDLVLEDLQIQRESGLEPDVKHYLERFPHLQDGLVDWSTSADRGTFQPLAIFGRPPPELEIGSKLEDFRILRGIGRGAFANVYLALQETLQRFVALKVSQRSSEETLTLSQLDHPNIVRIYDERNPSEPPVRLLYMQFVAGGTLAECLQRVSELALPQKSGKRVLESIATNLKGFGLELPLQVESSANVANFDWPTTVAWMGMQLAEGLDYAHARGILHRDVKPANILLATDATPKLADFNVSFSGLAGRAGAAAFFGGSLAYMSPEQLEVASSTGGGRDAAELDCRADLFSLGMVMWEMLHGERPWRTEEAPTSWSEAVQDEMTKRTWPLPIVPHTEKTVQPAPHQVLDRTIRQCLQPEPIDRPQSGRAVARSLRLVLHPRAAKRLFPQHEKSLIWLNYLPRWMVLTVGAALPNSAAAVFNFIYNNNQIVSRYPELWPPFFRVATWVNCVLFPLGIGLTLWLVLASPQRLRSSAERDSPPKGRGGRNGNLGHHVALVCGACWLIAGLVFPLFLLVLHRSFAFHDALHFFSSLTICGGVAMVYPFFWINWVDLKFYYPRAVARDLIDPNFLSWTRRVRRLARFYLLTAAAIPLIALGLLVLSPDVPRYFLLATILTTAIGFGASFLAVQYLDDFVHDLADYMEEPGSNS